MSRDSDFSHSLPSLDTYWDGLSVSNPDPDHDARLTEKALAVEVERARSQAEFHRLALKLKFAYSIVGLVLGLSCILAGLILGLFGVVGHTSLTASLFGFTTNLSDAAPGVVVFVVGIFMVLITRFGVREEFTKTTKEGRSQRRVHYYEP
jgi:hypothetical protein